EQEGTYRLPEAQLDRFLFKIEVTYPSLEEEVQIIEGFHKRKNQHEIDSVQAVLSSNDLAKYREQVRAIHVEKKLIEYIAQLVHTTRSHQDLYLGASPRASLAVLMTAKAFAAMQGRDFVTPEDVAQVVKPTMRHRVMLSPEKEMEGRTTDDILDLIVSQIEVPR
ncbi:MAG: AAA family ATPase, partial [Chitinophagales bacterium]